MDANETLLLKNGVYRTVGCALEVLNGLGHGLHEKPYENALVVDAKVIEAITNYERGQMLNHLRITGHKVGVILNFKRAKLEWERMVLDKNR